VIDDFRILPKTPKVQTPMLVMRLNAAPKSLRAVPGLEPDLVHLSSEDFSKGTAGFTQP
jgi:hypothetical protein